MKKNTKTLTRTVNDDLNQRVEEMAEMNHMNKSQMVRAAIQKLVDQRYNLPAEVALLVQLGNQLAAIEDSVDETQYSQIIQTLESIIKLKG